ncbi:hypothetical protein HKX48_003113 [Thoreauomyces humboldtii]|nr:hypothetical protein HKX48_003113 [Thoreauomyces humboldtii]
MSVPSDTTSTDVSLTAFVSALISSGVTALAFYLAFTVIRRKFPLIYAPRTFLVSEKIATKPLHGYFSWLSLAWKMDDADTIRRVGADNWAAVFYMRQLARLFLFMAIPACIFLMPIYGTGNAGSTGLNKIQIGNVALETKRLWATLIFSVIFIAGVIYIIFVLLRKAAWLRHHYLLGPDQHQSLSGYTLLVRDIPKELRDPAIIRDLFNRVQPNKVLDVILIRDVKEINKLYEKQMKSRNAIEKASAKYLSTVAKEHAKKLKNRSQTDIDMENQNGPSQTLLDEKRPTHKRKMIYGEKLDTISHNLKKMGDYESQLRSKREKAYESLATAESAAFVIFADLYAPHVAALANIHGEPGIMLDKQAVVEPEDVIWNNLDMKLYDRLVRGLVTTAFLTGLIVLWGTITAALSAIATLKQLVKTAPFLGFLLNIPQIPLGIIQGLLPTIAVAILFSLLPVILRLCTKFSGAMTHTAVETSLIRQYYGFLLFNVFLIITISGSLIDTVKEVENNPGNVLTTLASSIPKVSSFYVNYITLLALSGPAGTLLQIGNVILMPLKLKFLAGTPRAVWKQSQPPFFQSGVPLAAHSFIATLGIIYMTIAPLITICCFVYFAAYYIVYCYMMQYVFATRSQTGGLYVHIAAKQLFFGLYIHELVMVVMFALNKAWVQVALVILVTICTIEAHLKAVQYTSLMNAIPAKAALDIGSTMDLNMDVNVQRELVSNESWRDEVDAQIALTMKQDQSRKVRAKNSTAALLDGSRANLSEDSMANEADYYNDPADGPVNKGRDTKVDVDNAPDDVIAGETNVGNTGGDASDKRTRSSSPNKEGSGTTDGNDDEVDLAPQPDEDSNHPLKASGPDAFEARFMHPALRPDVPTVWIAQDELGLSESILKHEIQTATSANFTYEDTTMDRAGKIKVPTSVIARDTEP